MPDVNPYLIVDDKASGTALTPLPARDRAFQEDWLQELLFRHPTILPIEHLDDAYAPLVSLGREICGIDDLYVSPSGQLTVVETKLWRNAEAHRTVVAQILEYAKTLAGWDYSRLDEAVRSYSMRRFREPRSIYGAVKNAIHSFDLDEIEFEQQVQLCLTHGRFALVVVGDRIFPEATQLADTIQAAPHMQFTMGFVELRCYRMDKATTWPLVVFPQVVAKTKEVTRAVVRVVYEEKRPDIHVTAVEEDDRLSPRKTNLSLFLASLPSGVRETIKPYVERWMSAGYTVYWGKVGFSLRIPWRGRLTTLFDAYPTYMGILPEKRAKQYQLAPEAYGRYKDRLTGSPVVRSLIGSGRRYPQYQDLSVKDIALILDAADKLAHDLTQSGNEQPGQGGSANG